jgi:hypothetical protein
VIEGIVDRIRTWFWFIQKVRIGERELTPTQRIVPCRMADKLEDLVEITERRRGSLT